MYIMWLVGNPNDETNPPQKLLLTDTQVLRLCKSFSNKSSDKMEFP